MSHFVNLHVRDNQQFRVPQVVLMFKCRLVVNKQPCKVEVKSHLPMALVPGPRSPKFKVNDGVMFCPATSLAMSLKSINRPSHCQRFWVERYDVEIPGSAHAGVLNLHSERIWNAGFNNVREWIVSKNIALMEVSDVQLRARIDRDRHLGQWHIHQQTALRIGEMTADR